MRTPFRHYLCRRVGKAVRGDDREPALGQDFPPFLDAGAGEADDQRHRHIEFLQGLHDPLGDPVAAIDAGKDVDEDRLDIFIRQNKAERFGDAFRRGASPMSRKLAGSPPACLMTSMVAIASPAPLMMHPIEPVRPT